MKEEETTGPGLAIEGPIKFLSWISSVVRPQSYIIILLGIEWATEEPRQGMGCRSCRSEV